MDAEPVGPMHELPSKGLLGRLDPGLRRRFQAVGEFETLKPGARVAIQGAPHHTLSVIIDGKLSVTCHRHGDVVKLAELGPGETVGEMSIIDPQASSADVTVVGKPARLWKVSEEAFETFVDNDPAAGYEILKVLAAELCRRIRHNSDALLRREEASKDKFLDMDY
jgi:CRP-like cAMP-binding protein